MAKNHGLETFFNRLLATPIPRLFTPRVMAPTAPPAANRSRHGRAVEVGVWVAAAGFEALMQLAELFCACEGKFWRVDVDHQQDEERLVGDSE